MYYRAGSLTLENNMNIQGSLIVRDKLYIRNGTISITAQRNVPAIVAGTGIEIDGTITLNIRGLVESFGQFRIRSSIYQAQINVLGAVYISSSQITADNWDFGVMNIVGDPEKAAIEVWSAAGLDRRWIPASGAHFKRIQRL
jgi:hypothetical protein